MTSLLDLFEPKLPPINLWCVPPASWFYRKTPQEELSAVNSVRTNRVPLFQTLYRNAQVNK